MVLFWQRSRSLLTVDNFSANITGWTYTIIQSMITDRIFLSVWWINFVGLSRSTGFFIRCNDQHTFSVKITDFLRCLTGITANFCKGWDRVKYMKNLFTFKETYVIYVFLHVEFNGKIKFQKKHYFYGILLWNIFHEGKFKKKYVAM